MADEKELIDVSGPSFWKTYDWSKFLSREFLVSILVMAVASVFVYIFGSRTPESVGEMLWWWTASVGGFAAWWMGNITIQKSNNLKANVEALKTNKGRLPR